MEFPKPGYVTGSSPPPTNCHSASDLTLGPPGLAPQGLSDPLAPLLRDPEKSSLALQGPSDKQTLGFASQSTNLG